MATGTVITRIEKFPFRKRRDFTPKPLSIKEYPIETAPLMLTPVKSITPLARSSEKKKEVSFKEPEKKAAPLTPVTVRTPLRNITPKKPSPPRPENKDPNVPTKKKATKPRQDTPRKLPSPSIIAPAAVKTVDLEERIKLLELRLATVESRLNAGCY